MVEETTANLDQIEKDESSSQLPPIDQYPKSRRSLSRIRRELSEDDLKNPAVQKLLISEIDRLEEENQAQRVFQENFHATDKEKAILEQKLKISVSLDIIFGSGLSVGAAIIGLSPTFWDATNFKGPGCLTLGLIIMIGAIVSRLVQR